MMVLKALLTVFTLLLISFQSVEAYPIFFKCNENEGLEEVLPNEEFAKSVLQDLKESKNPGVFIEQLCRGKESCIKELKKILALSEISREAAQEIVQETLEKMTNNESKGIGKVSKELFESQKKALQLSQDNLICRKQQSQLDADSFIRGENKLLMFYPFHSNYMYITGCRQLNPDKQCEFNKKDIMEKGIEDALLMGTDPYLAVTLGLMETGQNGINRLYLDPVGKMEGLGCEGKQLNPNADVDKAMNSYGGLHVIESEVIQRPELAQKLKGFLSAKNLPHKKGEGYLCRDLQTGKGQFSDSPQKNQCCLETGFQVNNSEAANGVSRALTMNAVGDYVDSQFRDKEDPAFRIQRFNGYSRLMGGTEGVQAFRSGLNFYEDPAYGYQSMDFILNSLLSNPAIRKMVEEKKKELGTDFKSILCRGKPEGHYHIDSQHYFNKSFHAKRMEKVKEKWEKGSSFKDLTSQEQNVMRNEFNELSSEFPEAIASKTQDQNKSEEKLKEINKISKKLFPIENEINKLFHQNAVPTKVTKTEEEFLDGLNLESSPQKDKVIEQAKTYYQNTRKNHEIRKKMRPLKSELLSTFKKIRSEAKKGNIKIDDKSLGEAIKLKQFKGMGMSTPYGTTSDIVVDNESKPAPTTKEDFVVSLAEANIADIDFEKLKESIKVKKNNQKEAKPKALKENFLEDLRDYEKLSDKKEEANKNLEQINMDLLYGSLSSTYSFALKRYKTSEEMIEDLEDNPQMNSKKNRELIKKFATLKEKRDALTKNVDQMRAPASSSYDNDHLNYYFENLYENRKYFGHAGQATGYRWEKFNQKDIRGLRRKIEEQASP